jgi:multiple sugar transport system substrate-binding protein
MSKIKYRIAFAAAVVLLLGGVIYIYNAHYASFKPDEPQELSVWYVNDDALWSGFNAMCDEYNETNGADCDITIKAVAFDDQTSLYESVCDAIDTDGQLPDILACDTDFAAYLDDKKKLADMDEMFGDWDTSGYNKKMLTAAKSSNGLVSVPIAAETDVFVVNTELFSDSEAISSFEKLCSVADEYYSRNSKSFFTISDYSLFFRDAVAQLGESFDGVSPHDTDSDNCKYIYKQLAETAYNRGFTSSNNNAVALLADGEIASAIISSADIMKYAEKLSEGSFEFISFPYMKDGNPAYTQKVTGMTVLASNNTREKCALMFMRWFTSQSKNSDFVSDSGYLAAIGKESSSSEYSIYAKLMDAVDAMQKNGKSTTGAASAEYSVNSRNFDSVMSTIMNSLN